MAVNMKLHLYYNPSKVVLYFVDTFFFHEEGGEREGLCFFRPKVDHL